jgi:hypothetical protein
MNITTDKEILKDLFVAECSDVYISEIYINAYTDYIRFVAYEPASECKDGTYWNEKTGSFETSKAIVTVTKVLGDVQLDWGEKHFPCIETAKNAILTLELADMAGCLNKLI